MIRYIKHTGAFIVSLIYFIIIAPSVFWGDGGFIISAAYTLGIPHPTGHPLFALFGKFISFIPLGNIAFRMNIMAVLFLLISFYLMVYLSRALVKLILKDNSDEYAVEIFSVITAIAFCFSQMMLFQASSVETYSLNLFISLLITAFLLKAIDLDDGHKNASRAYFLAGLFVLGLGLGNHSLLMMCLGLIYAAVFIVKTYQNKNYKTVIIGLLFLTVALSVYLYLPLRAKAGPAINHGNPQNLTNLSWVISAKQFRDNTFSPKGFFEKINLKNVSFTTLATVKVLFEQMYYYWIIFAALGFFVLFKFQRLILFYFIAVIFIEVAITYPPTFTTGVPLSERGVIGYYLIPVAFLYILSVPGLVSIYKSWQRQKKHAFTALIVFCVIICLSVLVNLFFNFDKAQKTNNYTAGIFAKSILDSMDYRAVFLTQTDAGLYLSNYLQTCEKRRNDISVVNRSMLHDDIGYKLIDELNPEILKEGRLNEPIKIFVEREEFVKNLQKTRQVYFETGSKFTLYNHHFYPEMLIQRVKGDSLKHRDYLADIQKLLALIKNDGVTDKTSLNNFAIAIYNLGNQYLRDRDPTLALKMYSIALEFNPDLKQAWTNIMGAYYANKEYGKAANLGEKLLKIGKDRIIYYTYISSLIELGQKQKAQKLLEEAVEEFGPDNLWQGLRLDLKEN